MDPYQCPDDFLCHEDDIVELLSSLDINKASGPNNISAHILKATAHSIARLTSASEMEHYPVCGNAPMWYSIIPKAKDID